MSSSSSRRDHGASSGSSGTTGLPLPRPRRPRPRRPPRPLPLAASSRGRPGQRQQRESVAKQDGVDVTKASLVLPHAHTKLNNEHLISPTVPTRLCSSLSAFSRGRRWRGRHMDNLPVHSRIPAAANSSSSDRVRSGCTGVVLASHGHLRYIMIGIQAQDVSAIPSASKRSMCNAIVTRSLLAPNIVISSSLSDFMI